MSEIQETRASRINQLHTELAEHMRTTIEKAIEIGGILTEQKAELQHGQWLPWLQENAPFSERTARDYMRFYDRREELKTANLADLTEARRYLAQPEGSRGADLAKAKDALYSKAAESGDISGFISLMEHDATMAEKLINGIIREWPESTPSEREVKKECLTALAESAQHSAAHLSVSSLRATADLGAKYKRGDSCES